MAADEVTNPAQAVAAVAVGTDTYICPVAVTNNVAPLAVNAPSILYIITIIFPTILPA